MTGPYVLFWVCFTLKQYSELWMGQYSQKNRACVLPAVTVKYGRSLGNLILPPVCPIHTQTEAVDHMFQPSINAPLQCDGRSGGRSVTRLFYTFQSLIDWWAYKNVIKCQMYGVQTAYVNLDVQSTIKQTKVIKQSNRQKNSKFTKLRSWNQ